jgi:hypothetical protein
MLHCNPNNLKRIADNRPELINRPQIKFLIRLDKDFLPNSNRGNRNLKDSSKGKTVIPPSKIKIKKSVACMHACFDRNLDIKRLHFNLPCHLG